MSTASFDTLLHALYGCCANPGQWPTVMDQLRTELGVRSAVVQRLRVDGERLRTVWVAQDSSTNHQDYFQLISDQGNPRMERRRLPASLSATGQLSSDETLFTRDEQALRAGLQQQLSRIGLGRFLGGVVRLPDGEVLALALHRNHQDHQAYADAAKQRVLALLPHLSQAVSLQAATQRQGVLESLWQACADQGPGLLLICDREGTLHWASRLARQRLQALGCEGAAIRLQRPEDERHLRQLLRHTQAGSGFMPFRSGAQDYHLRVQALAAGPALDDTSAPGLAGELLLLSISSDPGAAAVPHEPLISLFGLTGAEARLLSGLVEGLSLQEYAQRRGISVGTVRQQLKQVFAKTGAARQSELVRRVLGSVASQGRGEVSGDWPADAVTAGPTAVAAAASAAAAMSNLVGVAPRTAR